MAIITKITQPSNNIISTLNGIIQIDEGRGLMRIYDSVSNTDLVRIDSSGFLFNDGTNRRIILGRYAMRVGQWISKPGIDVITALGG